MQDLQKNSNLELSTGELNLIFSLENSYVPGVLSALRSWMEFTPSTLTFYWQKKQFFKYNLGKFLKYITFSSCSLNIFESLPKLYLKNCFFSIKCQNGGGEFYPRSGSTGCASHFTVKCCKTFLEHCYVLDLPNWVGNISLINFPRE